MPNQKPEIVAYNFGEHNKNLEATNSRIMEGATWKKQRIIVLLPSAPLISAKVALSHWNLIFPPNQAVYRMLCLGMEVGEAYSHAIEQILEHSELSQWEYILTIEHDNVPPPEGVLNLIKDLEKHPEYACIGGLYFTKGEGGCCQLWGSPTTDPVVNYRPQVPIPGKIIEAYGVGMGFNLWRISMFKDKKLRRPWFKTRAGIDGTGTQDLYFCEDARKYGYRFAVDCDIHVGHYDHSTGITW